MTPRERRRSRIKDDDEDDNKPAKAEDQRFGFGTERYTTLWLCNLWEVVDANQDHRLTHELMVALALYFHGIFSLQPEHDTT